MKSFILLVASVFSVNAFAVRHPASTYVQGLGNSALQIMSEKSETARFTGLCSLLKKNVLSNSVAAVWLGNYRNLNRDQAAVREFTALIPSILMNKAMQALGGKTISGSFTVNDSAVARGNGIFEVGVNAQAGNSNYSVKIITYQSGAKYRLLDAEYMGFSMVNYMKSEYLDILDEEYNKSPSKSMPVTVLVNYVKSQADFTKCP